jgi:ABC-type lipoprotein export system ATPase subunit
VVIVTHDARTLDYADRVVDIEDGRIAAEREAGEERYLVAEEG